MRSKNIDSISLDVAFYFNTIGGFPIEIETKIKYFILCCYHNFINMKLF